MGGEKMVNRLRKNVMREYHETVHRRKYLYQTLYHSSQKCYYEDYEWIDSMIKELEIVKEKEEMLIRILELK